MKTIEEEAREYRESVIAPSKDCQDPRVDVVMSIVEHAFISGVEFAQRRISVEKELPPCSHDEILIKGD
jgi:hypothetical protein